MKILSEIDVDESLHQEIQKLRNTSFPHAQVERSYYKQLPHYRALQYEAEQLIAYTGLDYRMIRVGKEVYKILGIIDFCIREDKRGQGVGSSMLRAISDYAEKRAVDFIILMANDDRFYLRNGFQQIKAHNSWLRIDKHKNYGVAFEYLDELYIKPIGNKTWQDGHVDWLGYMF